MQNKRVRLTQAEIVSGARQLVLEGRLTDDQIVQSIVRAAKKTVVESKSKIVGKSSEIQTIAESLVENGETAENAQRLIVEWSSSEEGLGASWEKHIKEFYEPLGYEIGDDVKYVYVHGQKFGVVMTQNDDGSHGAIVYDDIGNLVGKFDGVSRYEELEDLIDKKFFEQEVVSEGVLEESDVRYPDLDVELIGHDGNAFAILGKVIGALKSHLRKQGLSGEEIKKVTDEYQKEATSGDYDNLLATTMGWVNVTGGSDEDDYSDFNSDNSYDEEEDYPYTGEDREEEIIVEKSYPGRASGSGLENIDKMLQSTYDKMSQMDKDLKDKIWRAYYRYYNDGDFLLSPKSSNGLKKLGVSDEDIKKLSHRYRRNDDDSDQYEATDRYAQGLEAVLEAAMKYFLNKYKKHMGPQDRADVNMGHREEVYGYIKRDNEFSPYWIGEYGKQFGIKELVDMANAMKAKNDDEYKQKISHENRTKFSKEEKRKIEDIIDDDIAAAPSKTVKTK